MIPSGKILLLAQQLPVMLTMVLGAFVAGSSPEGSAAIAYPVFTLLLGIEPDDARNFAFAIQSIGMTAASLFILGRKIRVDLQYIQFVTLGGLVGLLMGTWGIVPYVTPVMAKLVFVSLWLAFGLVLYLGNKKNDAKLSQLPLLTASDMRWLVIFGILGGMISALFGTGINMLTFCFVVLYFRLDEKVATPSSILIMTIETLAGFALHAVVLRDISQQTWNMWLACIPVVIFMAPLGSWFISKISRFQFQHFLYFLFLIQYVGAILVIQPGNFLLFLSASIIFAGVAIFWWMQTVSPFR